MVFTRILKTPASRKLAGGANQHRGRSISNMKDE
jgi:hypothetical protein